MPVLEAMVRGIPVLTSSSSALPEVAGDAALLVHPEDIGNLTDQLVRLCADESLRMSFAAKGLIRVKQFSWEKAVTQTWAAYDELAGF
jgi:glycosyltransferase involved in cell wall biosynthesis